MISDSEYYMNYVAPRAEAAFGTDEEVGSTGRQGRRGLGSGSRRGCGVAKADALDRKFGQGNPIAAQGLAKLESKSIETGKSPKEIKQKQLKQSKTTQEAKLLTILVEFDENANDDFTEQLRADRVRRDRSASPATVQNGPLHNNIPNPADYDLEDNNSMWVPDFSSEHFNKMLFTDEGITERVRTDLTGPDGKPGFDISGYTMKTMYEEMSRGAYTVTGEATPWITVPHSEAYYGASLCFQNDDGRLRGRRDPGHAGPPRQPARRGPAARSTRSRRSPMRSPTSRGPTTTSRTRATATATATCSSPTA